MVIVTSIVILFITNTVVVVHDLAGTFVVLVAILVAGIVAVRIAKMAV